MCGVNVNGKPVLACWEEATPSMVIEPLGNMPVIRDLTVDRSAFERATIELEPRLVRKTPYTVVPRADDARRGAASFELMNCIECYVCSAACPAVPGPGLARRAAIATSSGPAHWCRSPRSRCIPRTSSTAAG